MNVNEIIEKILERLGEEIDSAQDKMIDYSTCMFYDGYGDGCQKAVDIIKQVAEEYNNGWIPVSERLPNQDGEFTDVLITCESIADGVFVQSAEFYITSDGEPVFDALYNYERVLAWQPLPLPYKERDSNAEV